MYRHNKWIMQCDTVFIHLILHHCIDWILLDPVHANVASFWRLSPDENPHKCRERAHCMVCCLTASHTKQNSSTKDLQKRRVLFHLPFEVIFGMLRRSSHDIRAATYKPLLRPPSQCPRPGKDWCTRYKLFQPSECQPSQRTAVFHPFRPENFCPRL